MSGAKFVQKSAVAAVAVAAACTGFITSAAPAQAAVCTDWVFREMTTRMNISSGDKMQWGGGTGKDSFGPGIWSNSAKTWDGAVSAHITGANSLSINYTDSQVSWDLIGTIDSQGIATGNVTSIPGATFRSDQAFECNVTGEAAATPTGPGTATVTSDVDIYQVPDGVGTPLPGVFLNAGDKYTLVEPCRDNWCHLAIPSAPGGTGWAYQDGFLDVS